MAWWPTQQGQVTQRDKAVSSVTAHTNGPYLSSRPKKDDSSILSQQLGTFSVVIELVVAATYHHD